ncbi:hypothetical protein C0Q70_07350 [Pomacea canaliculata]|uniref:Orange domain-containing protein n=1 Tax=Pomacea canaliculata TaxID=400727 RepID=A0A2T7PET7_POMCA|nr:hypothetical protein C0Q70_07350 [Pomacea canaliculata]
MWPGCTNLFFHRIELGHCPIHTLDSMRKHSDAIESQATTAIHTPLPWITATLASGNVQRKLRAILVAVEGLDLQDPLRMRLLSHLQCYSAQREAAAKATLQPVPPAWPPAPPAMHPVPVPSFNAQYGAMVPTGGQASSTQGTDAHSVMTSHAASSSSASSVLNVFSDSRHMAGDASGGLGSLTAHHARGGPAVAMTTTSSAAASQPQAMSPPLIHSLPQFHASQFPPQSIMPSASHAPYSHAHSAHAQSAGLHPSASVKPYRPWGGELAY